MTTPDTPDTTPQTTPPTQPAEAPAAGTPPASTEQPGHGIGPTPPTPAPTPPPALTPKQKMRVFLVTVALALGCMGYNLWNDRDDTGPSNSQITDARLACEHAVEDRLVSPASADFSSIEVTGTSPTVVTGFVDSDNAFGATIRNSFRCEYSGGRVTKLTGLTR